MRSGALALALGMLATLLLTAADAEARGCGSFKTQAAAQSHFLAAGGSPRRGIGLDRDRDGVACESLPGPYKGFATLGFNRRGGFLYGLAWLPATPGAAEPFACLFGNRSYPEGPRRAHVFRLTRRGPVRLFSSYGQGAGADRAKGRLGWKAAARGLRPGRYFVEIEERQRLGPYEPNLCPSFRSRPVRLP